MPFIHQNKTKTKQQNKQAKPKGMIFIAKQIKSVSKNTGEFSLNGPTHLSEMDGQTDG